LKIICACWHIDRDAWSEADLNEVCKKAHDLGYFVALSNPCFELWLYLHLKNNCHFNDRHQCQREFGKAHKSYGAEGKAGYDAKPLVKEIAKAIERSKAIDIHPADPWPKKQATRVYLLVEKLFSGKAVGV
jgi:RloB-like protein